MERNKARTIRHFRIRKKISGTPERPRLCVFRSNDHIEAQIIDDDKGHTIVSASSKEKVAKIGSASTIPGAKEIGKLIAQRALKQNIESVLFDRAGYKFHGRIAALAEGAREEGLKF